ncbi:hypothetical protein BaRGS_00012241 [Batillaria attramentaria]|uniref:Uncharacterized protein n=1 Tax=Batillaria attramentaria TaxID=370345 RepID=A0ABD0LAV8_9CAEN
MGDAGRSFPVITLHPPLRVLSKLHRRQRGSQVVMKRPWAFSVNFPFNLISSTETLSPKTISPPSGKRERAHD